MTASLEHSGAAGGDVVEVIRDNESKIRRAQLQPLRL